MDFKVRKFACCGGLWQPLATCGGIILALKKKFRILEARIFDIRVLEARGFAGLAGFARRRIGTTKSNTLDALERSADCMFCLT